MALIQDKKTGELKKLEGKEKENWLKTDRSVEKKGFLSKEQMKRHKEIKESKRQSRKEVAMKMGKQEFESKNPTKSSTYKSLRLL